MIACNLPIPLHSKLFVQHAAHSGFRHLYEAIENRLMELLPLPKSEENPLIHAMHTGVLAPGKRTRSVMMMLACNGLNGNTKAVLDLACSVEMVHTASLFMDDLPCMDNAHTRRGLPAAHVQYGQDVAMLAAVALLAEALRLVASTSSLSADVRSHVVVVLSRAVGPQGLAKGQYLDLHNGPRVRGEQDIAVVNGQKTGALFSAALEMTALACNASIRSRTSLQAAAIEIGQAFQMRNDLEDGSHAVSSASKERYKDIGKSTMVSLLGRETVQLRMRKHLADAVVHLQAALPKDEQMVKFTMQAFGLPSSDMEPRTASVETGSFPKRSFQHMATG